MKKPITGLRFPKNARRTVLPALLLSTILSAASLETKATHFRYGALSWARTNVPGQVKFSFKAAFRRGSYTGTGADGRPVTGNIITETVGTTGLNFGQGPSTGTLRFRVTSFSMAEDWIIGEAIDASNNEGILKTYTGAGPFNADVNSCCRLSSLINGGDDPYILSTVVYPTGNNSSPVATIPPIVTLPVNQATSFAVTATDPNNDNVRFRIATPAENGGMLAIPGLTINQNTGVVSWNTTGLAPNSLRAVQVIVEDLDVNGVVKTRTPVDFILKVITATSTPPQIALSNNGPITVNFNTPINLTVTGTDVDPGASVTIGAAGLPSGANMFPLLPVTGLTGTSSTLNWTPTLAQVGSHVIVYTVTDNTGLQVQKSVAVNVTSFNIAVNNDTICAGDSATLAVTTNAVNPSYLWSPGGATTASIKVAPNSNTQYTVQVTQDNTPAVRSVSGTVVVNPLPTAFNVSGGGAFCVGGSGVEVGLSGSQTDISYQLQHFNGVVSSAVGDPVEGTGNALDFGNQTESGVYTIVATNTLTGCTTNMSGNASVDKNELPNISAVASDVFCNGGTTGAVDLTVTGGMPGYTYQWSNNANSEDINGLVAGTYDVTVMDANGCTATASYAVAEPTKLTAVLNGTDNVCNAGTTGSVDLSVTGGTPSYTYLWSNSATTEDISALAAGTYSVAVTDANGCTETASYTVAEPTALSLSAVTTNVLCYGNNSGAADLTVSGGTPSYTYLWSNNATTEDINSLAAGTYNVAITDANGCTSNTSATITQPANAVNASIAVSPAVTVNGQQAYTIYLGYGPQSVMLSATSQGGTGAHSYNWSPASQIANANTASTSVNPTSTTAYVVTITDGNGCTKTVSQTIKVVDVRSGNKIRVCHGDNNAHEVTVASSAVPAHLAHGDKLGDCPQAKFSSVEDFDTNEVKVYPNPSTGMFTIELPSTIEAADISIVDLSGRIIEKKSTTDYLNKLQFDLRDVAKGVYMLQVQFNGQISRSKINIQ